MFDTSSKSIRILEIYDKFSKDRIISKSEEAINYHVDERTIQRDIDDIRAFI